MCLIKREDRNNANITVWYVDKMDSEVEIIYRLTISM